MGYGSITKRPHIGPVRIGNLERSQPERYAEIGWMCVEKNLPSIFLRFTVWLRSEKNGPIRTTQEVRGRSAPADKEAIEMTVEQASPVDVDRRPGVVTFVAVILFINALMAVFVGVGAYLQRDNADIQANLGLAESQFIWYMVAELVLALLVVIVALGILSGAKWARMLVTIGMGIRLVQAAVFATAGGEGSTGVMAAAIYVLIPLLVLWAVWGHDKGEAWFHRISK